LHANFIIQEVILFSLLDLSSVEGGSVSRTGWLKLTAIISCIFNFISNCIFYTYLVDTPVYDKQSFLKIFNMVNRMTISGKFFGKER